MPAATVKTFAFRASKPLVDTAAFETCGLPDDGARAAKLWTRDAEGESTMEATATW